MPCVDGAQLVPLKCMRVQNEISSSASWGVIHAVLCAHRLVTIKCVLFPNDVIADDTQ
jgi:hypothetical protein